LKIDIKEIFDNKVKQLEESGIIEKALGDAIEKTVLKAIDDALDGYSLQRSIEDKISREVSEVVSDLGFTAYNSFIVEKLKAITEGACREDIAQKIQKLFDEMLVVKRDNIKLSEICEKYREWICEDVDEQEKYDLQRFYVSISQADSPFDWITIKFAKEEPKRYGDTHIEFTVHRNHDKTTGRLGRVVIDGYNVKEKINFKSMSDIELLLINLVYNETPIIIDVEDDDDVDSSFDVDY
jgi:DNA-binding Lrp family transcriptional regulator